MMYLGMFFYVILLGMYIDSWANVYFWNEFDKFNIITSSNIFLLQLLLFYNAKYMFYRFTVKALLLLIFNYFSLFFRLDNLYRYIQIYWFFHYHFQSVIIEFFVWDIVLFNSRISIWLNAEICNVLLVLLHTISLG